MGEQEWQTRRRSAKGGWLFSALLLVGIGIYAAKKLVVEPMGSPVATVAAALKSITQRETVVKGDTVTLSSAEARELVVVKRRTKSMIEYKTKWLGSEKQVVIVGEFVVKAGFQLDAFEGFEVRGQEVVGEWPEPRVLSVDLQDMEIFFSKSGLLNRLKEGDYEAATNQLLREARRDAIEKSGILEEADRIVRTRLEDLTGKRFEFREKGPEIP